MVGGGWRFLGASIPGLSKGICFTVGGLWPPSCLILNTSIPKKDWLAILLDRSIGLLRPSITV